MTTTTPSGQRRQLRLDRLDRSDWMLLRALIALVALGAAVSMAVAIGMNAFGAVEFTTRNAGSGPDAGIAGQAGAVARHTDAIVWTLTQPTPAQRILVALPLFTASSLVLACAWFLARIVGQLRSGDDFGGPTLRALRNVALILVVGGIVWPFVRMGCEFALNATVRDTPDFLFSVDAAWFLPFVVGLLLIALLGVFRKGAVLAEDAGGLV